MTAPIHTSLALAFLTACFLSAITLAQGQAPTIISPSTNEFPISVGENDMPRVREDAHSRLAVGSILGFSFTDQHRERRAVGATIHRITLEPGCSEDGQRLAHPLCVPVKGARLSTVRDLDDLFIEMSSAHAARPEHNLLDRDLVDVEKSDRGERATVMLSEYLEGRQRGSEALLAA